MKKILIAIAILFFISTIFFLSLSVIEYFQMEEQQEIYDDLLNDVIVTEIPTEPPSEDVSHTETKPTETTTETKPTTSNKPKYVTPKYIDVSKLSKQNKDIKGWICLENSPINYPILSSNGNEYLNKNYLGNKATAGSIYFYDNQIISNKENKLDKNIVLFGHNMRNGTMFSYLNTLYNNPYYLKNHKNQYIFLYNENEILKYEIYSVYRIEKEKNYAQVYFKDEASFIAFCDETYKRSVYKDGKPNFENQNILTLSTCSSNNSKVYRTVLHAVLIDCTPNNY